MNVLRVVNVCDGMRMCACVLSNDIRNVKQKAHEPTSSNAIAQQRRLLILQKS